MDSIRIITFCYLCLIPLKTVTTWHKAGYVQSLERLLFKSRSGRTKEKHGLDLQAGNEAGAYVAKWGLEHEMTKGHIKKAKENNRTPSDILRSYTDSENQADSNLFKLYYFAFKGTRQLNWSKGLKSWLAKQKKNRSGNCRRYGQCC